MFRRLTLTATCAALIGLCLVGVGTHTSQAATGLEGFDAAHLITDENMYGASIARSMNASQIQTFLEEKAPNCRRGRDGSACLKNARFDSVAIPATAWCPHAFAAGKAETASSIIARAAQACNISPRVLLVILQKEQGLITTNDPTRTKYARATGFACPDTAPCSAQYAGFVSQVYNAASRLQQYRLQPQSFRYRVGQAVDVQYHPNRSCGTRRLTPKTAATAALYNYTPYLPNSAALAAVWGNGDKCSAYGNRNFFRLHSLWFTRPNVNTPARPTPTPPQKKPAPPAPSVQGHGVLISGGKITRISGADRYATAVSIAVESGLPTTTIHVASGESFADGLTMGALAGREKSPLLLVRRDSVPEATATFLRERKPKRIRVAGGSGAISEGVTRRMAELAGGAQIERLAGADRYETSARIAAKHPAGTNLVLMTDGTAFPDALVAGGAAAHLGEVVLLTRHGAVPAPVATQLGRLDPWEVDIIGGAWTQAEQQAISAAAKGARVKIMAGKDRYLTAALVAATFWTTDSPRVTVATGSDFADAMAAAPFIAVKDSPLLLARPGCIEAGSGLGLQASTRFILGGPSAVPESHVTYSCR